MEELNIHDKQSYIASMVELKQNIENRIRAESTEETTKKELLDKLLIVHEDISRWNETGRNQNLEDINNLFKRRLIHEATNKNN